jgi:hypothetical protein
MLGINCTELTVIPDAKRVMADMAAFGFRHVRFEVAWQLVQPVKGSWNWDAVRLVRDAAKANGITLLPILGVHMAPWAYTPADFGEFCRRAAIELQAPAYEIGNEPNLQAFNPMGKADPIVPLIRAAFSTIKGVQPAAKIVFPGLAACATYSGFNWFFWLGPFGPYGNTSPEDFLTAALKLGVGPWFDIMAYHPYSIGPGFDAQPPSAAQVMIAKTPLLRTLLRTKGIGVPLWATEWGFDANLGAAEVAKRFTVQLPLMNQMCDRSYLFAWRDYVGHGGNYGLVDANNKPRQPLFDTVKAVVTQ